MKKEHPQDEITWDTVARNLLEKPSSASTNKSTTAPLKLKDRVEYVNGSLEVQFSYVICNFCF